MFRVFEDGLDFDTNFLNSQNENKAFSIGKEPERETILPFTRLMEVLMDDTPGIFKINFYSTVPVRQVHTTLAKQHALYVTIYSPVQMAPNLPENYELKSDAFILINDVLVDWDDTKNLEAEPGDYVTIARRKKGKDNWFFGVITDENSRKTTIPLGFLTKGKKHTATIYGDAESAHWKNNAEAYKIEKLIIDNTSIQQINSADPSFTL